MSNSTIMRHGSHLMSLASLAALVVCLLWGAAMLHILANPETANLASIHPFGALTQQAIHASSVAPGQYFIALLPPLFAVLLPCLALRRLGATLGRGILLAPELAQRLRHLGWALSFSALLSLLVGPLVNGLLTHGQAVSVGITTTVFIEIVGALLAFSMARVVDEALRLEQENRSFL